MSLQIYVEQAPEDAVVITDVKSAFNHIKLKPTALTCKFLDVIEQGQFLDENFYRDRYDYKISVDDMSEGCKAALCVEYFPDKVINTIECGINAISTIVAACSSGSIIIRHPIYLALGNVSIDVVCNGYSFTAGADLTYYLENEYPLPLGTFDRRLS